MIRVTTLFARTAEATAAYYGDYLTKNKHELPGQWTGKQAPDLGLIGEVTPDRLEAVLLGRHPFTGESLGRELLDRIDQKGNVIKAVAGYDATFSAPKSVSVLWGLTGDEGFAECHDRAVDAAIEMIEKYGSTTRIRSNGTRLHPETRGLTIGVFRQSTSRADDPQLHTHVVISSKVQTADGRWYALDGRVLKRHQQAFGYFYQSVLRAELTARYGVAFDPIVNGQAEIAGVPTELLHQFSKRAHDIAVEMDHRVAEFIDSNGREPSHREFSAMEREASGDTRARKTGLGAAELRARWTREAATLGHDPVSLVDAVNAEAQRRPLEASPIAVADVLELLAERGSTWNRLDVLRAISDLATPQPGHDATTWAAALDQAVDTVLDACIDLDPAAPNLASPIIRWAGAARRARRTSGNERARPGPGGADHHLGARRASGPAGAVDDGRRPRARRWSTRRGECGRWTRSARARRRPGRCRQDTNAPSRRHRSPRTDSTGDRVRTDGQGGPCPGNRDRHAGRHGRQAPLRTRPPRPEPIVVGLWARYDGDR